MGKSDGTLPADFQLLVNEEAEELLVEFEATTPEEIREVAQGLAVRMTAYDESTVLVRAIVERLGEMAANLQAKPN